MPFDIVDGLTGTRRGRAKSAAFRTADVVGLDTMAHVIKTMADTLPDDPWHKYFKAPSGLPLVQHAVQTLFDLAADGQISHELIVDRACHAPADIFGVEERGYVREGWYADLVIVDPDRPHEVTSASLLSKCQWSPYEGHSFTASIDTTIVNGQVAYRDDQLTGVLAGQRMGFGRAR